MLLLTQVRGRDCTDDVTCHSVESDGDGMDSGRSGDGVGGVGGGGDNTGKSQVVLIPLYFTVNKEIYNKLYSFTDFAFRMPVRYSCFTCNINGSVYSVTTLSVQEHLVKLLCSSSPSLGIILFLGCRDSFWKAARPSVINMIMVIFLGVSMVRVTLLESVRRTMLRMILG